MKPIEEREREQQEFLIEFAHTIIAWQHIEQKLFEVFRLLIRGVDFKATSAAFHSIINLNARLKATNNAATFALEKYPELSAEWVRLSERIRKLVTKRNAIAHSMLSYYDDRSAIPSSVPLNSVFVRPDFSNVLADADDEFDIKRLKSVHESFRNLYRDLVHFANKLWTEFGADLPDRHGGRQSS